MISAMARSTLVLAVLLAMAGVYTATARAIAGAPRGPLADKGE